MAIFGKRKPDNRSAPLPATTDQTVAEVKAVLPQGEDAAAYQVVIRPHLTEKASLGIAAQQYVFRVNQLANKFAVKQAIEKLYKVHVAKVATISLPAKQRRLGRQIGQRPGFKKAIVTLRAGDKIDITT